MKYVDLFSHMNFVTAFCHCCREQGLEAGWDLANAMTSLVHGLITENDGSPSTLAGLDKEHVKLALAISKCLLNQYSMQEREKEDYDRSFGTGELNQKLSNQLAELVTSLRDHLDEPCS